MNSTFSDEDRQYLQMGRNHLNNFVNKAAAEIPIKKEGCSKLVPKGVRRFKWHSMALTFKVLIS